MDASEFVEHSFFWAMASTAPLQKVPASKVDQASSLFNEYLIPALQDFANTPIEFDSLQRLEKIVERFVYTLKRLQILHRDIFPVIKLEPDTLAGHNVIDLEWSLEKVDNTKTFNPE
jgi:hypothetical protein